MKKIYAFGFGFFIVLLFSFLLVSLPEDSLGATGSGGAGVSAAKSCGDPNDPFCTRPDKCEDDEYCNEFDCQCHKLCESDEGCPPPTQEEEDSCDSHRGWDTRSADRACRKADADAKKLCEGNSDQNVASSCETYCENCEDTIEYPSGSGEANSCDDEIECVCDKPSVTIGKEQGQVGFWCTVKCCGQCCCVDPEEGEWPAQVPM